MGRRCPALLLLAVAIHLGTGRAGASESSEATCLADSVGDLRIVSSLPDCAAGGASCSATCTAGDANSCLAQAYLAEEKSQDSDARSLYQRACLLGLANACTNYAATIWAYDHTDEQIQCAARIFDKACAAKEHFACGMVGRLALANAATPAAVEAARLALETSCRAIGGFSCRVLAKHLEAGDFGPPDPGRVAKLLERACQGGDPDACHNPATASETFE